MNFNDAFRATPLTNVLIALSVIVALLSGLGQNIEFLLPLFISEYRGVGLPEIYSGQLWRLFTPIIIHFGLIHILFNMLWLYDLGRVIEYRQGTPRLGILVGSISVLSNLGEFYWTGPGFGGMSGVVYGLLGYIWAQGRFNARAGLGLNQPVVVMMLIWFVVCWLGLVGNIANMAHTLGLACGTFLGWVFSPHRRPG